MEVILPHPVFNRFMQLSNSLLENKSESKKPIRKNKVLSLHKENTK